MYFVELVEYLNVCTSENTARETTDWKTKTFATHGEGAGVQNIQRILEFNNKKTSGLIKKKFFYSSIADLHCDVCLKCTVG